MTYADKGLALFSLMNDMSDELIHESDIRTGAVRPEKVRRTGRFSAFLNHPAMVAVLCAVVSLSVVAAIVLAGRHADVDPPAGVVPPASSHVWETDPYEETLPDMYMTYSSDGLHVWKSLNEKFRAWKGETLFSGFVGSEEQLNGLPTVKNTELIELHVSSACKLRSITVYDTDMAQVAYLNAATTTDALAAGVYYVALRVEHPRHGVGYDYVFSLSLNEAVTGLTFDLITEEEAESSTYVPTETVYVCTLVAEQTIYSTQDDFIKATIVAAEPGKIWSGNGSQWALYRLEGDEEIYLCGYYVEPWCESYPKSPDDYATVPLTCSLIEARRVLAERGETLTAGTYRMYYCADTYLGIESPYVDVVLVEEIAE